MCKGEDRGGGDTEKEMHPEDCSNLQMVGAANEREFLLVVCNQAGLAYSIFIRIF